MYCPICGTKLVDDAIYCHRCGTKAPVLQDPPPAQTWKTAGPETPAPEAALPVAYTAEPEEQVQTAATTAAFTFENGYDPNGPDGQPPEIEAEEDAGPKPPTKKTIILLSILAGILLLAVAAGTFFGLGELYTRRDKARLQEAICRTWTLEGLNDGSAVLLTFHEDGSGICVRQTWFFEEPIAAFSFDVTGKDSLVIHYNGTDKTYTVLLEQDKTVLRFTPPILIQTGLEEIWSVYRTP